MKNSKNIIISVLVVFLVLSQGWVVVPGLKTVSTNLYVSPPTITEPIRQTTFGNIHTTYSKETNTPDLELIKLMKNAKDTLYISIYTLTKTNIVDAIIKAKKRGIEVHVITDAKQSENKYQLAQIERLTAVDVPVLINTHEGIMHLKEMIVDNTIVTVGSYNWTESATTKNDEIMLTIRDAKMAQDCGIRYKAMWYDTIHFAPLNFTR